MEGPAKHQLKQKDEVILQEAAKKYSLFAYWKDLKHINNYQKHL